LPRVRKWAQNPKGARVVVPFYCSIRIVKRASRDGRGKADDKDDRGDKVAYVGHANAHHRADAVWSQGLER